MVTASSGNPKNWPRRVKATLVKIQPSYQFMNAHFWTVPWAWKLLKGSPQPYSPNLTPSPSEHQSKGTEPEQESHRSGIPLNQRYARILQIQQFGTIKARGPRLKGPPRRIPAAVGTIHLLCPLPTDYKWSQEENTAQPAAFPEGRAAVTHWNLSELILCITTYTEIT